MTGFLLTAHVENLNIAMRLIIFEKKTETTICVKSRQWNFTVKNQNVKRYLSHASIHIDVKVIGG